jgi:hypothetical protein
MAGIYALHPAVSAAGFFIKLSTLFSLGRHLFDVARSVKKGSV